MADGIRAADEDNTRGYFELERVKQLALDDSWLDEAQGKSIKVISALLERLPARYQYRIVFMQRDMDEILASQRAMLIRRGRGGDQPEDQRMAQLFEKHLIKVRTEIEARDDARVLFVDHADVIKDPLRAASRVNQLFDKSYNEQAMADAVEGRLYRQRRAI